MSVAARALPLVDLTSLNDDDTDARIRALCEQAVTPAGPVAAVCVYPRFVALARGVLGAGQVRVATVANFPAGLLDAAAVGVEAAAAVAAGADEVDVVLPYEAYLAGEREAALGVVRAARSATEGATLKVILETGRLVDPSLIREAAGDALDEGADFVKSSTGKLAPGATPEAARAMLEAIREVGRGGFKASGGIRTVADAAAYLALADSVMGAGWASVSTFRFGASGLVGELLADLGYEAGIEGGSAGGGNSSVY